MASCGKFLEYISARLDGELSPEGEAELEAHLSVCPSCRALADRLAALRDGFEALEEVPAPEGFAREVMDRIQDLEDTQPKTVPLFRWPWVRAMAGLAACLVLCIGVWRGVPRPEPDPDPEEQPSSPYSRMAPAPAEDGAAAEADVPAPASLDPDSALFSVPAPAFANPQYLRIVPSDSPEAPSAQILGSADSLARFLARLSPAQGPEDELSAISAEYGSEFFKENRLLAITLEEPSGSIGHELTELTESSVTVLRQVPEETTADTAAWLILAEVDAARFTDGQTLEVILAQT